MCDRCNGLTRRDFIASAAALGALALSACTPPVNDLPDVYQDHVMDEFGGRVKIDTAKIVIPPKQTSQASDYGTIMPRTAWTTSSLTLKNPNPMNGVTELTLHHSGDGKIFAPKTAADVARHLQIVLQAHLQRGMIDIGYHFAVDPLGTAWQLRSLAYEGQHTRPGPTGQSNNVHNIGIVALGDFEMQTVTPAQRDRLLELVRLVRSKYALKPDDVRMHGEIVQTDCPGKTLKAAIVDARTRGQV